MRTLFIFLSFSMCYLIAHAEFRNIRKGEIIEIDGHNALVFQVDDTGEHGKAMYVKAFRGEDSPWCTKTRLIKNLPDLSDEINGDRNTQLAIEFAEKTNSLTMFPVLNWCKQLGLGWYIPSYRELESFVNYWLGNNEALDWDDDSEEENDVNQPHYKIVNQKLIEAGGIPFLNGVFTSTMDNDRKVFVFDFRRFYTGNLTKNTWQIRKIKVTNLNQNNVGRAFIKF